VHDRFDTERILAHSERAQPIDRALQRAAHRAGTKEGKADALYAFVGAEAQRDEILRRARGRGTACERLVERQPDDVRFDMGDFHEAALVVVVGTGDRLTDRYTRNTVLCPACITQPAPE
jgi:hypothetical protein